MNFLVSLHPTQNWWPPKIKRQNLFSQKRANADDAGVESQIDELIDTPKKAEQFLFLSRSFQHLFENSEICKCALTQSVWRERRQFPVFSLISGNFYIELETLDCFFLARRSWNNERHMETLWLYFDSITTHDLWDREIFETGKLLFVSFQELLDGNIYIYIGFSKNSYFRGEV